MTIEAATKVKEAVSIPVGRVDDIASEQIGQKVVIVGGSMRALDIAMYLLEQGKQVSIVMDEPEAKFGYGHSTYIQVYEKAAIFAHGLRLWDESSVTSVGDGEVTISRSAGVDVTLECDTLVDATAPVPNNDIA